MRLFRFFILGGMFVFYASLVLLFQEKESHFGPWPSRLRRVIWAKLAKPDSASDWTDSYTEYTQPVTLFDWVRRLFGAYAVQRVSDDPVEEVWYVKDERMEVWTCPVCLSFWLSLVPTVFYKLVGGGWLSSFIFPFAVSGVSVLLHGIYDALSATSRSMEQMAVISYSDSDDDDEYAGKL
ncbi:hypothetical protein Rctr85_010 [Virus Rctr85]|nr:hypothetical protein Rctr85_010 [Virus Rctr85]